MVVTSLWDKYGIVPGRGVCVFDPATLTVGAMAGTAAGGGLSAMSTLAGGDYAKTAGLMQKVSAYNTAQQLDMNAAQSFASGQRKALETTDKTRLAISSSTARAAGSGVNAGVGSPATNVGEIEQRGSYHALMDMFNGESEATGLRNQANATRFSGDVAEWEGKAKKRASQLAAAGTLASTAGSMAKSYGGYAYPEYRWGA